MEPNDKQMPTCSISSCIECWLSRSELGPKRGSSLRLPYWLHGSSLRLRYELHGNELRLVYGQSGSSLRLRYGLRGSSPSLRYGLRGNSPRLGYGLRLSFLRLRHGLWRQWQIGKPLHRLHNMVLTQTALDWRHTPIVTLRRNVSTFPTI
jgi:hypothetical protein